MLPAPQPLFVASRYPWIFQGGKDRGMSQHRTMADRITAAIKADGRTHAEIAEAVGVSRPVLSQWGLGTRKPSRDNLLALAQVLNVSMTWLHEGVHVIRVEDDRMADLLRRLHDAPEAIRNAVETLLPPPADAA
jgi:transcriptional regulator with XRE-family HTH domain